MTGDLRVIETETGPVYPVTDICASVGYSRSSATRMFQSHKASFVGLHVTQRIKTRAGGRDVLCLTKEGAERFLSLMVPDSTSRPALAARVEQFKASMFDRAQLPAPVAALALSDVLNRYADAADILIDRWNYKPEVARSLAMTAAVEECPALLPLRGPAALPVNEPPADIPALPAPATGPQADPDFEKYHSLGDVARFAQCTSENAAHKILEQEGVIECVNRVWRLTRYGERFGKMFPVYPLWPHRPDYMRWLIRYSPEAVQLVRGKLFGIQTHLPQKATTGA